MFVSRSSAAASLAIAIVLLVDASPARAAAANSIVVSEATNAQVTVSPDHKTILADIQGLIYAIPFAGGTAKQLTKPEQEASHPDWSPRGDRIALQCYAGGTFHIWTMRPDGTGLKQVTSGHGDDREPRISPDGSTIAFTSDRAFEGSYDIWTVAMEGGEPKRITSAAADEFGPSWAPDGKRLAFISGVGVVGSSIQSIDLESGQQTVLKTIDPAKGRFEAPSWSPDGKRLAYVEFEGGERLINSAYLKIDGAADSTPVSGKAGDTFPFPAVWLSDKELLYTADGKILRANLDAGTETPSPSRQVSHSSGPFSGTRRMPSTAPLRAVSKESMHLHFHLTASKLLSLH